MAIRVVTDSTADLPPEVAEEASITVVPLNVHFGEETYRDGLDISADEFYRRLAAGPRLPTTSQPSVGAFLEIYRGLQSSAEGVVSVHISASLSGTCNSALQAQAEMAGSLPIDVVDTGLASLGLGLAALAAARAAAAGASFSETSAEARRAAAEASVLFMVDTLEFLEKGGRIGKASAFLGSILNVKPILTIREGGVHPLERARTRARAVARLAELVQDAAPLSDLAVIHSTTPEQAQELAERLTPLAPEGGLMVGRLGAVVGTYAGPGLLGVAFRRKSGA